MKIAVIGSGISGLSSAYFLSKKFKVDLYEKADHFGGHSFTYDIKEGDNIEISFDGDEIISLLLPAKTVLKVTQTDPGHKGNTATNALKPAILETGLEVQVPLFINEGDLVKIDTKDGSYSERVKE